MNYKHPAPTYRLTLDGNDISPKLNPWLEQLTLSEARSDEADQLDITLSDHLGQLQIPRKGITLRLSLGYAGEALIDKGAFIVDEVNHRGPPDKLTIRARSAELTHDLRRRRDQSWHSQTLGAIVRSIATRNGLTPRIDSELAGNTLGHIDQSNESDIAFVTRLARHFDAVATVKSASLLFLKINGTRTSSGQELPTINLKRNETQNHDYTSADRDSYSGVRAAYHNVPTATRDDVLVGDEGNVLQLPDIYANRDEASKAAKAEWQRVQRSAAQLKLTLSTGRPDLMPQSLVQVDGFKSDIDSIQWLAVKVSHSLTKGAGLITSLELETAQQQTDTGKSGNGNGGGGFWQ